MYVKIPNEQDRGDNGKETLPDMTWRESSLFSVELIIITFHNCILYLP